MEITVNRGKMIDEIEKDLKEYQTEYQKSKELYKKKLAEYSKYVERVVQNGSYDSIKSPPYPPTSKVEDFEASIEMLKAHVDPTLKLDDDEYKGLKSGIKQLHVSNTSSFNALSALSY